ncbi:BamA/TamA family outer membrane protein [Caballeronia sp. LZ016]|uniref:BamA/TamA family outer membrane protein n=1 Tax=Caballeronia sp. LZ016 TaxID=3038554 RepID=UPI0028558E35|nr:BamA/TamA family outer membrane protein [Caballeronia sp. LZ016]MDR5740001.1 BamA/TamA family outer membrane protein [Caballeronia sp. LZ016]
MVRSSIQWLVLYCLLVAATAARAAREEPSRLRDTEDGQFDMSDVLLSHRGVLPVPNIITEPAIGYGLGLGLLYFTAPKHEDGNSDPASEGRELSPPNITGVGAFGTGTHSWGVGVAHFHTWMDDHIRYFGALGRVNLHLNWYGPQGNANAYQLSGVALVQQVLFKLGGSPWYIGPRYTFFDTTTRFGPVIPSGINHYERDVKVGKAGVVVDYDTRDNIFFPSKGTYAEFEADFARGGFGSDDAFEMQTARGYHWMPVSDKWVLGLRADTGFSQGDIPFFVQPYVNLRGISQAKYQDRNQLTGEVELRYNITPRWSVLGFGGLGKAYGNVHSFSDAPTAFAFGAGFRYLIARKLGISMGIDVAHGPGQNAFYVQVGSAWR